MSGWWHRQKVAFSQSWGEGGP